jgi:hypothetical protein
MTYGYRKLLLCDWKALLNLGSSSMYTSILNRANAIKANVVKGIIVLSLLLLLPVSPAFATVDHGYDGGDNYVGVQWHLGISTSFDAGPSGKEANIAVPVELVLLPLNLLITG